MAVFQELAPGDTLLIGGSTRIRLEQKSGGRARLRIESDEDIERVKAGDTVPGVTKKPVAPPQPLTRPAVMPQPTDTPRPLLRRS